MAARTGLPTVKKFAQQLCTFLAVYIPVVEKIFPEETEVITALKALKTAACDIIPKIDPLLEEGD